MGGKGRRGDNSGVFTALLGTILMDPHVKKDVRTWCESKLRWLQLLAEFNCGVTPMGNLAHAEDVLERQGLHHGSACLSVRDLIFEQGQVGKWEPSSRGGVTCKGRRTVDAFDDWTSTKKRIAKIEDHKGDRWKE